MTTEIGKFFNKFSTTYENEIFNFSLGTKYLSNIERNYVRENISVESQTKILEVGVGTGRFTRELLSRGANVYGMDVSKEMVNQARASMDTSKFHFKLADVGEKIPFKDNEFHYALCFRVLKYVPNWKHSLSEFSRVLKKDGILLMSIDNKYSIASFGKKGTKYFLFDPSKVIKELQRRNFRVLNVKSTSRLPFPFWKGAKSRWMVNLLKLVEDFFDKLLPSTTLSRSVMILAKRK